MSEQPKQPYLVEMRSGGIVEYLTHNGRGGFDWTLDRGKALRFTREGAHRAKEWCGCGGKNNVQPVRQGARRG